MKKKPNIVMIVADQLNYKNLGCYGHEIVKTPNIDNLAEEGVLFENAYCQGPLCMPSRASFNTGLYPHACGVRYNPSVLREEFLTLAEMLRKTGYKTGGFGHIGGDGIERGFEVKIDLPDEPLRSAWMKEQAFVLEGKGKPGHYNSIMPFDEEETFDGIAARAAVEFIENTDDPFFLQLDFYKPHPPCFVPEKFAKMYNPDDITLPATYKDELSNKPFNVKYTRKAIGMEDLDESKLKKVLAYYYASISYIDYLTGLVIEKLENKGLLDNTLVVFIADHGDYAAEFGIMGKTGNFYDCLTHIPFIMTGKNVGVMSGKRIESLVELIDIMPTIAEVCGVQISDNIQGSSRLSLARGKTNQGAEAVFSETSGPGCSFNYQPDPDSIKGLSSDPHSTGPFAHQMQGVMIRKGDMKLVYYSDGSKELYDLGNDPDEKNNIADKSSYQPVVNELMELLLQRQINTFMPDIPQKPLAYHYRAFSIDSLPDSVIEKRLEWESEKFS